MQAPLFRQLVDVQVVVEIVVVDVVLLVLNVDKVGVPVVVGAEMEQVEPVKPLVHWHE